MKRTTMFHILVLIALILTGCTSANAQCAGGRCYSYGAYTPWAGFWYYQSPCSNGRCGTAKPKQEPAQEVKAEEPADPEPVEFKPFCERVAELINKQRVALGLPPLVLDQSLCSGCDSHSAWMSRNGFQHAYGIGGRECIAMGVRTPEAVVNLWLNSSGHRAIILGGGRTLGVGCSGAYWTLRVR